MSGGTGGHGKARRERTSEDPWVIAYRVVHDLRRDGIRVHHADDGCHMPPSTPPRSWRPSASPP